MENQIVDAVTLGGSVADLDFSMISLFMRADLVVKSVIVLLLPGVTMVLGDNFRKIDWHAASQQTLQRIRANLLVGSIP